MINFAATIIWLPMLLCLNTAMAKPVSPTCVLKANVSNVDLAEVAKTSDYVGLVKIRQFKTIEHEVFDGEYIADELLALKGDIKRVRLLGNTPYTNIPQRYIDLTEVHNKKNLKNYYPDDFPMILLNQKCFLSLRMLEEYQYLVFAKDGKVILYEPINSPQLDKLYKYVKNALLSR